MCALWTGGDDCTDDIFHKYLLQVILKEALFVYLSFLFAFPKMLP